MEGQALTGGSSRRDRPDGDNREPQTRASRTGSNRQRSRLVAGETPDPHASVIAPAAGDCDGKGDDAGVVIITHRRCGGGTKRFAAPGPSPSPQREPRRRAPKFCAATRRLTSGRGSMNGSHNRKESDHDQLQIHHHESAHPRFSLAFTSLASAQSSKTLFRSKGVTPTPVPNVTRAALRAGAVAGRGEGRGHRRAAESADWPGQRRRVSAFTITKSVSIIGFPGAYTGVLATH